MNGYENYPDKIESDIDIIVESFIDFKEILLFLSEKLDFQIIQSLNHEYKVSNFFISKEFEGKAEVLSLDIYEHYLVNNRILFNSHYFLEGRTKFSNFYIPNKSKGFVYYFVKKIVKLDVNEAIDELFHKFKFDISFKDFFHLSYLEIYTSLKNKNKEYFLTNAKFLRKDLFRTTNSSYKLMIHELSRKIKRVLNPTGLIISFLGPDGSGKSTIINELDNRDLPFRRIDYFHLNASVLSKKGDGLPVQNPHKKSFYWGALSYLKLFHFMLEYILGWCLKVIPLKIKSSLIIFDRYYDDLLVDPKRYRYGGSVSFASMMRFFIPKPELYFVLIANKNVIHKRKQEVEIHELERQLKSYNSLIDGKQYIYIDVDREVCEIVNEIELIIFNKLNERF